MMIASAGSRQRVDLPAVREDDRVEARDQADHREQRQQLGDVVAVDHAEAVEQRLCRRRQRERAVQLALLRRADRRVQQHDHQRRDDQREHAEDQSFRHVAFRIDRFLGGERQLLDREEQPYRERQRREHA
jgi:hypothetical protein